MTIAARRCSLLFLVLAALAAPARGDFVRSFAYASPDCTGSSVPAFVDFSGCFTERDVADEWFAVTCTSRTSYNVSLYDNAQCSGMPTASGPAPPYFKCEYIDSGSANNYFSSTCVTGSFDPMEPEQLSSLDVYLVTRGSAGGATCPPAVGVGVNFYKRQYLAIFGVTTLDTCVTRGSSSAYLSCDPRDGRSLVSETFNSNPDCSGTADIIEGGCVNQSAIESTSPRSSILSGWHVRTAAATAQGDMQDLVLFFNAGGLCLPPAPAASISPASLLSIGAGAGVAAASLAFAFYYAYQRAQAQRRGPADASPLLGTGVSMVQAPRYTA